MLSSIYDPTGAPNILQRRKQQLEAWNNSETNRQNRVIKDAERVQFPNPVKFWAACSHLDVPEIERLLKAGVDINVAKSDGITALHQACIDNAFDMVKYLLEKGANVNIQDHEGWTPLHATAQCGYTEIAKLLIDKQADLSVVSFDGELALDVAQDNEMTTLLKDAMRTRNIDEEEARCREEQMMLRDAQQWLQSGGGDGVGGRDARTGATPLHVAAAKEYQQVLRTLLQVPGVDVNAMDKDGWTPLHAAAHWGQEQSIRLLAGANASFDAITLASQSIMDVADKSVCMLLRQLREQQRLYRAALETTTVNEEVCGDAKQSEAVKRKSEGEVDDSSAAQKTSKTVEPSAMKKPEVNETPAPGTPQGTGTMAEPASPVFNGDLAHSSKPATTESNLDAKEASPKPSQPSAPTPTATDALAPTSSANPPVPTETAVAKGATEPPAPGAITDANPDLRGRRVSAVMAPAKSEETETQRSARARHLRSIRRSTQGITSETLEEAKRRANGVSSPVEADPAEKAPTAATGSQIIADAASKPPEPEPVVSATRRRRLQREQDALAAAAATANDAASTTSSSSSNSSSAARLRRSPRDRVPTGCVDLAELNEARKLTEASVTVPSATSNGDGPKSEENVVPFVTRPQSRFLRSSLTPTSSAVTSTAPSATVSGRFSSSESPSKSTDDTSASNPRFSLRDTGVRYTSRYTTGNGFSSSATTTPSSYGHSRSPTSPTTTTGGTRYAQSSVSMKPSDSSVTVSSSLAGSGQTGSTRDRYSWRDQSTDYRRLYEEEKAEKERLKRNLDNIQRELSDLRSELNRLNGSSDPVGGAYSITRSANDGLQRRLNVYEDQLKELNMYKEQNARMKEENAALVRVISKLSKPG